MKHSLLAVSFLLAAGAFADTYWTGANSTDWSGEGNWYKSGGNWVIGGAEWAKLPDTDPIKITFSKAETIDGGLWVEVGTSKRMSFGRRRKMPRKARA